MRFNPNGPAITFPSDSGIDQPFGRVCLIWKCAPVDQVCLRESDSNAVVVADGVIRSSTFNLPLRQEYLDFIVRVCERTVTSKYFTPTFHRRLPSVVILRGGGSP